MDITGLIKHFHLENDVEKEIEFQGYAMDRLELSAMYLLDEAEKRELSYEKALELCFLCKSCLGLTGGISNPILGKKKIFGDVLLNAALALQTKIQPPHPVRIKNKANLETYIPLVKYLENQVGFQLPAESDLRALIRLAMIVDYDCKNLIEIFKEKYPHSELFKSEFESV